MKHYTYAVASLLALAALLPLPAHGLPQQPLELLEAEARYRAAIEISPQVGAYHTSLGVVLQRLGRDEEARAHFVEATRLDPNSARAHGLLAEFLLQRGESAAAEPAFERAAELDRSNGRYPAVLGAIAAERRDWRAAANHFEHASALAPADAGLADRLREARERAGIGADSPIRAPDATPIGGWRTMERVGALLGGTLLLLATLALLPPILSTIYLALLLPWHALRRQPGAT